MKRGLKIIVIIVSVNTNTSKPIHSYLHKEKIVMRNKKSKLYVSMAVLLLAVMDHSYAHILSFLGSRRKLLELIVLLTPLQGAWHLTSYRKVNYYTRIYIYDSLFSGLSVCTHALNTLLRGDS